MDDPLHPVAVRDSQGQGNAEISVLLALALYSAPGCWNRSSNQQLVALSTKIIACRWRSYQKRDRRTSAIQHPPRCGQWNRARMLSLKALTTFIHMPTTLLVLPVILPARRLVYRFRNYNIKEEAILWSLWIRPWKGINVQNTRRRLISQGRYRSALKKLFCSQQPRWILSATAFTRLSGLVIPGFAWAQFWVCWPSEYI